MSQGHCGNVPAQRRQTVLHGAVQLGAVDVQTDAAQHRRVDLCLQVDGLAGEASSFWCRAAVCSLVRAMAEVAVAPGCRVLIVADAVSPRAAAKLPQCLSRTGSLKS